MSLSFSASRTLFATLTLTFNCAASWVGVIAFIFPSCSISSLLLTSGMSSLPMVFSTLDSLSFGFSFTDCCFSIFDKLFLCGILLIYRVLSCMTAIHKLDVAFLYEHQLSLGFPWRLNSLWHVCRGTGGCHEAAHCLLLT